MKKGKKRRPINRFVFLGILLILLGTLGVVFHLVDKQLRLPRITKQNSPYTDTELHSFWDNKLKAIVVDGCLNMKLPYPELNSRVNELTKSILSRTGKLIHLRLEPEYHEYSNRVLAAAGMSKATGEAEIEIFVPAMIDEFERIASRKRPDTELVFKSNIIIVILHEMEHLTYNSPENGTTVDIEEESRAWAETFRYSIIPLYETHRLPIASIQWQLYPAWKACDGNSDSPLWKDAIRKAYKPIEGKELKR